MYAKIIDNFDFCLLFKSDFVRLGEHDTDASVDANRVDIDIDRIETHNSFVEATKINDIAIVRLKRDVKFTGKSRSLIQSPFYSRKSAAQFKFFDFHCLDSIRPICLPTSKDMQSRSYVGSNPFVGN